MDIFINTRGILLWNCCYCLVTKSFCTPWVTWGHKRAVTGSFVHDAGKNSQSGLTFLLQRIFLIQESNPSLLRWQVRLATTGAIREAPESIIATSNSYVMGLRGKGSKRSSDLESIRVTYRDWSFSFIRPGLMRICISITKWVADPADLGVKLKITASC